MKTVTGLLAALALLAGCGAAQAGPTFSAVKARGYVQCGVNTGLDGFSAIDPRTDKWAGLDVDVCRAVAAAMFGDAGKVRFTPLDAQRRFKALQSGEVDLLARNTTWTLGRDADGLAFTVVTYYDGQGVMVPKALDAGSLEQLNGVSICLSPGTTTERNLDEWFRARKMAFRPVHLDNPDELAKAFFSGRCDALSADASQLASIRAKQAPSPNNYLIMPELISKEPLAPAVRHGDDQWRDLVSWAIYAMVAAEELGLDSANAEAMLASPDPNIRAFLGVDAGNGKALGVDERWAYNIVRQVGNYAESFERNVGKGSKLQLDRRLNALFTKGGLMYAPPLR